MHKIVPSIYGRILFHDFFLLLIFHLGLSEKSKERVLQEKQAPFLEPATVEEPVVLPSPPTPRQSDDILLELFTSKKISGCIKHSPLEAVSIPLTNPFGSLEPEKRE